MYKSMFRPEVIRRVELCFFRPCAKLPSLPWTSEIHHVVFPAERSTSVYINLVRCVHQPCAGSEPDCNCCCLSNKYTSMQLRSPEVTRVNFHLSGSSPGGVTFATGDTSIFRCVSSSNINTPHTQHSISICLSHTHTPHTALCCVDMC